MHQNRVDYTLPQYQDVLLTRWSRTLFLFAKKKKNNGYDFYFAKPTPRTVWLSGKPRDKYYKRLYARLHHQLTLDKKKYTFCTLTYHTRKYSREYCCSLLKSHLKEFIRRLRVRYPRLQYYWIIELTKDYYPHIHFVFDHYCHHVIIRAIWYAVTKSYITDIRMIPAGNLASYLSKYLTKQRSQKVDQFTFIFKNIDRLYGSSKYFFSVYVKFESDWLFINMTFSCDYHDKRLFRPPDNPDFWYIYDEFAKCFLDTCFFIYKNSDKNKEVVKYFHSLFTKKENEFYLSYLLKRFDVPINEVEEV